MFLADLYNNKRLFENISPIDLAEILFNALMQKYPEAVKRYGHEVVGDAVMNYAEDSEDIRSMSDVDIAVQEILDDLADYRGDRTNDLEPDSDVPLQEDQQLSIQDLAVISDQALDAAYGYGRSSPGNTFGWQANLQSAAYAKKVIDAGVTDIETIADAIHKGWNQTAKAFVSNPDQFSDTEKLKAAGKLEAKLQQRAKLMQIDYAALPEDEKEKDRVVARVLLQAIKGQNPVTENLRKWFKEKWVRFGPDGKIRGACARGDDSEGKPKCLPQAKAHALGKKGRKYAAAKKRREDPNPERRGPAKNVATKKKTNEDLSRRGFLKGLGTAAVAAAAGGANADWRKGEDYKDPMDDKVYRKFHNQSTDGYADLDYNADANTPKFQLHHLGGVFLPQSGYPNGRLRVDNGQVIPINFVIFSNSRNRVGIVASGNNPFGSETERLENYILSAKQRILIDVTELTRTNQKIITFNIQQRNESVEQGMAEGRFDEPLTGWHIVYRKSGNPIHATPSFETKDQAQKYLMTKMFANHQDYKVVHTAGVGVAEATEMPVSDHNTKPAQDYDIDLFQQLVQNYKPKSRAGELVKHYLLGPLQYPKSDDTIQLIDEIYYEEIANGWEGPSLPEEVSDLRFYRRAMKKSLYQGVAEGSTSHAELAKMAHDAYVAASRKGNGPMAAYYLKQYLKHKADAAKDKKGVAEGLKPEEISKEAEELVAKNGYEGALKFALMMANLGRDPSWLPIIRYIKSMKQGVSEAQQMCPECGGPAFSDLILAEKQDACYHKVKSRYKVWPSAYASGALVQCRKKGAANWGKKKTNEAKESPTQDYQKMMNFVQAQRLSGVPPEQQVAVALFKELEKTKAFNKQLDAELKAASQRADIGAEQGELATKELGKHRGELEKEKQKQQASRQQLQALSQQLEQLKTAPNVDAEASQAIEQQIAELEQKMQDRQGTGVSADKIAELEQAIANVQQGETVDADAIQRLEQQFKAAETAAKTAKEKVGQVKDYESAIAKLNAEIDALTAEVNKDEKQIADIQGALANTVEPTVQKVEKLEPQVNKLVQKDQIQTKLNTMKTAKAAAADLTAPLPLLQKQNMQQQELPLEQPVTETRFYFSPKATLAETLRTDFAMTQDSEGWYLTADQGPAKLLEAQRAFGIPKVKQVKLKEVRISDYTGRAGTIGDENATSPIGSLPRQGRRPA